MVHLGSARLTSILESEYGVVNVPRGNRRRSPAETFHAGPADSEHLSKETRPVSIHVALDYSFTHTEGAWRRSGSWVGYPYYTRPQMWEDATRVAERACIDMIFFGDGQGIPIRGSPTSQERPGTVSNGPVTT